jgi:hypothetical protein
VGERKVDMLRGFRANDPVSEDALAEFSKASTFQLPGDYLEFLRQMNGGEGFVGEPFIRLYTVEELLAMNLGYKFPEFFPGFFLLGTDGGGEAYAFRTSENNAIYQVPFIGGPEHAVKLAASFGDCMEQLANGTTQDEK